MKHTVELVNHVSYIRKVLPDSVVKSALRDGRTNGEKIMQKEIDKRIKALAKEEKAAARRYIKFQKAASKFYSK
jgi:hypothetical protein